jgi:hypothetical protein
MLKKLSLISVLTLVAGCSSGASTSSGSTTTADSTTTVVATTVALTTVPATTVPATTVPATTTTVAPAPLLLREDGLGPFDFGAAPTPVIDAITAQLGAPATDAVLRYDDLSRVGDGIYLSLVGPYYYALRYPVGRTACWTGDFCAEFGGASDATLNFIGWSYSGPAGMMASSANLTIGARWSDFPSMSVFATCYTTGGGTHTGMGLVVDAGTWDWLVDDGTGNYVPNLPDPSVTRVVFMEAGERPFQPELDC